MQESTYKIRMDILDEEKRNHHPEIAYSVKISPEIQIEHGRCHSM